MEPLWINDPSILFSRDSWFKFVPMSYMDVPTSLNTIVRFTVYFSIIMSMTDSKYLIAIPIVLVLTVLAEKVFPHVRTLEAFKNAASILEKYTRPTPTNPFMNPLLTEIQDKVSNSKKIEVEESVKSLRQSIQEEDYNSIKMKTQAAFLLVFYFYTKSYSFLTLSLSVLVIFPFVFEKYNFQLYLLVLSWLK
jgi:hypothetical protein